DVVVLDVVRSYFGADHEGGDHEHKPAEDCDLPVACAPAAHAGRDVVRALQGGHGWFCSFAWLTVSASQERLRAEMRLPGVFRGGSRTLERAKAAGGAAAFEEGGVVFGTKRRMAANAHERGGARPRPLRSREALRSACRHP